VLALKPNFTSQATLFQFLRGKPVELSFKQVFLTSLIFVETKF